MTAPMPPASPIRLHKALTRIWATGPGWQRLAAVNHSMVGLRFMVTATVFFAIGGMLAMLIRAQLATPGAAFLGPEIYNQIFTMHGTIMMFLFAILMREGLALYMLPKMLGARDLAFPRFSADGYWCYLFGGIILIGALVAGVAPQSGWFMYTPLSSDVYSPGINADVWLLGVTFVEISESPGYAAPALRFWPLSVCISGLRACSCSATSPACGRAISRRAAPRP